MDPRPFPIPSRIPRKTSGWSLARRRKHAAAMRRWKPWAKSTGPKTADGKARSALNALKHGGRVAPHRRVQSILGQHTKLLAQIRNIVCVRRMLGRYAVENFTERFYKALQNKRMRGEIIFRANELLRLAKGYRLIRLPQRRKVCNLACPIL